MGQDRKSKKAKTELGPDAGVPSLAPHRPSIAIAYPASEVPTDGESAYELAVLLAGIIARAAISFNVSEVVIYDDPPPRQPGAVSAPAALLARLLQALETPPYLRMALIPVHPDFRMLKSLPPLGAPHHTTEWGVFREGVVLKSEAGKGSYIDIGLDKTAFVPQALPANTRVTARIGERRDYKYNVDYKETMVMAQLAPPSAPRIELGQAWGFNVRLASSLSQAVKHGPVKDGYDLVVGSSPEGVSSGDLPLPASIKHVLLVVAPRDGFTATVERDPDLAHIGEIEDLLNMHVDVCPGAGPLLPQDSVLVSLAYVHAELRLQAAQLAVAGL